MVGPVLVCLATQQTACILPTMNMLLSAAVPSGLVGPPSKQHLSLSLHIPVVTIPAAESSRGTCGTEIHLSRREIKLVYEL